MVGKIFTFPLMHCCVFSFNSDTLHKFFGLKNISYIKPNLVELCHIALIVGC